MDGMRLKRQGGSHCFCTHVRVCGGAVLRSPEADSAAHRPQGVPQGVLENV